MSSKRPAATSFIAGSAILAGGAVTALVFQYYLAWNETAPWVLLFSAALCISVLRYGLRAPLKALESPSASVESGRTNGLAEEVE